MDIATSPYTQLETLASWLEENSRAESLPGQAIWDNFRQQMEDRSVFIKTFMLRNMSKEEPISLPHNTLDRTGKRVEGATFLGPARLQRPDLLEKPDEQSG